jgi:chromosome segregation ATPase
LLEEANNRINSLTNQIGEKDEQIKSLQGLLRETRTTILGLSDSLKERTIREKELFDEVLSEKKRMKKQIELLEIELKPGRRL